MLPVRRRSSKGEPATGSGSRGGWRSVGHLLLLPTVGSCLPAVTPFEFHDRRATDLGGSLLGFVLDVLASAELALNLDVVAFLESGSDGGQRTEYNDAMPFCSRSPFAGFAILP